MIVVNAALRSIRNTTDVALAASTSLDPGGLYTIAVDDSVVGSCLPQHAAIVSVIVRMFFAPSLIVSPVSLGVSLPPSSIVDPVLT